MFRRPHISLVAAPRVPPARVPPACLAAALMCLAACGGASSDTDRLKLDDDDAGDAGGGDVGGGDVGGVSDDELGTLDEPCYLGRCVTGLVCDEGICIIDPSPPDYVPIPDDSLDDDEEEDEEDTVCFAPPCPDEDDEDDETGDSGGETGGVLVPDFGLSGRDDDEANDIRQFVRDVLLNIEIGGPAGFVRRWNAREVTAAVVIGSPGDRLAFSRAVGLINAAFEGGEFRIVELSDPGTAQIRLHFGKPDDYQNIASQYGFRFIADKTGYYVVSWSDANELLSAHLMNVTDPPNGEAGRALLLSTLAASLGPLADSPLYADSIFYENDLPGSGTLTKPSAVDRRLLRFLYRTLKPGDQQPQVDAALDAAWPNK